MSRGVLNELPVASGLSEVCVASGIPDATTTDATASIIGKGFWYLVRGRNACGVGTYGFTSNGTERVTAACP